MKTYQLQSGLIVTVYEQLVHSPVYQLFYCMMIGVPLDIEPPFHKPSDRVNCSLQCVANDMVARNIKDLEVNDPCILEDISQF